MSYGEKIKKIVFFLSGLLGAYVGTAPLGTSAPFTLAYVFAVMCFVNEEFSKEDAGITLLLYGVGMLITYAISSLIH